MEREENDHGDISPDNWLNSFEEECIEELHSETNMEEALEKQRELSEQKLWLQFQNSATAIAQLYKGICLNLYNLCLICFSHFLTLICNEKILTILNIQNRMPNKSLIIGNVIAYMFLSPYSSSSLNLLYISVCLNQINVLPSVVVKILHQNIISLLIDLIKYLISSMVSMNVFDTCFVYVYVYM